MSDIAELVYPLMQAKVKGEKVISQSKTDEDVLQDVVLRAIKVSGDKDIDFQEGKAKLMEALQTEIYFAFKKIANEKLVYVPSVWNNEELSEKETSLLEKD